MLIKGATGEKQGKSEGFDSCDRPSNLTQIGFKSSIFQATWPWNLMYDLKNHRAPLLHYIKLCASSQTPRWIQTGVTVRKRSIRVKISDFFVLCDLEIWCMTLKNNRAPLLCHIKLCASFQSHRWIQTKATVLKTLNSGQNRQFIVPRDLEIWQMTLKNNRTPLICCFKVYASVQNHPWIQTEVTVRKRSIRVKISDFLSRVTLKFDRWPWKQ